jgi:hypothetical protein
VVDVYYEGMHGRCIGHSCSPMTRRIGLPPNLHMAVKWGNRPQQPNRRGIGKFALLTLDGPTLQIARWTSSGAPHGQPAAVMIGRSMQLCRKPSRWRASYRMHDGNAQRDAGVLVINSSSSARPQRGSRCSRAA